MSSLEVIERGTGAPILWIHGFPLSSLVFEFQLEIPGVRHIVPDLPGFGRSRPGETSSIDAFASLLLDLLDEKGIDRAVVAGVSMGGYIALSMLRQRPEAVSGLILIDTRETPDSAEARANRLVQIERVGREGTGFIIEAMMPRMLTPATIDSADRRFEIVRDSMRAASPDGVRAALRAMADRTDSGDMLRSFRGPALVAVGTEDELTPPADSERMASLCGDATLIRLSDAAHLSHVERPGEFNRAVRAFMDRLQ